jgi:DnaJ-class molecular chaperone
MSAGQVMRDGLAALGPTFSAELCEVCKGEGRYEQTYTIGCGMGTHKSMGCCDYCDGQGVTQQRKPASASIINQIMQAGLKALATHTGDPQ